MTQTSWFCDKQESETMKEKRLYRLRYSGCGKTTLLSSEPDEGEFCSQSKEDLENQLRLLWLKIEETTRCLNLFSKST